MSVATLDRPEEGVIVGATAWPRAPKIELSSRARVLLEIAERYDELISRPGLREGTRGLDAAVPLMPRSYTASVREFERLVVLLHREAPRLWNQLDGFVLSARCRTVWLCPRCGVCHQSSHQHRSRRHRHRLETVQCKRVLVWSVRSGCSAFGAAEALEWLGERWGLATEPMVWHPKV